MIIKKINTGVFHIDVKVKEIIYGNTQVDKLMNYDIESTTLKLRCEDCTVMVFKRDFANFRDIPIGFEFKALVHEWKKDIYNFKELIK